MAQHKLVSFGDIDRTADAGYFIRFLDIASAEVSFQAYKQRTFDLLEIRPGQRILEIACGTGTDARSIAQNIGTGQVVGVDFSQAMIAEAQKRSAGTNLPVEFHTGDAHHLAFADASFDGCRCDRSFMHMPDPRRVLAEMMRVVRPGGRIVVFEVDFGTLTLDAPDRRLARKILNTWNDGFRNGWLGRYVPGMCRDLGWTDVRVEPAVLRLNVPLVNEVAGPATVARAQETGAVTAAEAVEWLKYFNEALQSGRFFSTLTGFIVSSSKPVTPAV